MNEPALPGDAASGDLAAELERVILAVDGVTDVYPARPLWQSIAGAARSAVTGAPPTAIQVEPAGTAAEVRARIGISGVRPAPDVARAVAAAVRAHLSPRTVTVRVQVALIRSPGTPAARESP